MPQNEWVTEVDDDKARKLVEQVSNIAKPEIWRKNGTGIK